MRVLGKQESFKVGSTPATNTDVYGVMSKEHFQRIAWSAERRNKYDLSDQVRYVA